MYRGERASIPGSASAVSKRVRWGLHRWLLLILLIASSNLVNINDILCLERGGGGNVLGLRDVSALAVIVLAVVRVTRGQLGTVTRNPYCIIAMAILALTPLSVFVALNGGSDVYRTAITSFSIAMWALVPAVAILFHDPRDLGWAVTCVKVIGVLVGWAIILQVITGLPLAHLRPDFDLYGFIRLSPHGQTTMMVALSLITAGLIFDRSQAGLKGLRPFALAAGPLIGMLLTQSRTLLVAYLGGTFAMVGAGLVWRPMSTRVLALGWVAIAGVVAVTATIAIGSASMEIDFANWFGERYSVLLNPTEDPDAAGRAGGRIGDVQAAMDAMSQAPLTGIGLGSLYDADGVFRARGQSSGSHNVIAGFAARYGVPGLGILSILYLAPFVSLWRFIRQRPSISVAGTGLAGAAVTLNVCSLFAGAYTGSYWTPQSAIALGLLAGHEILASSASRRPPGESPAAHGLSATW